MGAESWFPSTIQRLLQMWQLNSWTTRQLARPCADVLTAMHATWSGTKWRSPICRPSYELPLQATCPCGVPRTDCPEERYKPTHKCLSKGDRDYDRIRWS